MNKIMGLPRDVSCEIGSWANYEAYCKHYNRLGAVDAAALALNVHLAVHTAPSPSGAAKAPLHTPPRAHAGGRSKGNKAARRGWTHPPSQSKAMLGGWWKSTRKRTQVVKGKGVVRDEGPQRKSARTTSGRQCTPFVLDE